MKTHFGCCSLALSPTLFYFPSSREGPCGLPGSPGAFPTTERGAPAERPSLGSPGRHVLEL